MKIKLLLIVSLVCSISYGQQWTLGAKGGVNISSASIKNLPVETSSTIGFHLGGYASTAVTDQISVQPEVLFSLYGWKSETINETRTLSYISIPVAVKYFLVENFNLQAGPQISFLVDASDDFADLLKSTDFGVHFGAEYQITELIGATIRYNLGISNVLDSPETEVKIRSRILQLSASYRLSK